MSVETAMNSNQQLRLSILLLLTLAGSTPADSTPFFAPQPPLVEAPFRPATEIVASADGRQST